MRRAAGKLGHMRLGLFPAKIEVAAGGNGDEPILLDQVRYYGTDEFSELWFLVNGKPEVAVLGPGLVKQGRGQDQFMADGTRAKWTLLLADGTVWLASPGAGCGCGHKLKSFDPSKAVRA